jgi:hypothetical protein
LDILKNRIDGKKVHKVEEKRFEKDIKIELYNKTFFVKEKKKFSKKKNVIAKLKDSDLKNDFFENKEFCINNYFK